MDKEKRWGQTLAILMFLTTNVHCQNQTTSSNTTGKHPNATNLEDIVPGTLKIGSGNVFEAPQLFGGQPFSLKTDPVTGKVDFQTKTVDVQAVNAARDREEAKKVAELHEDIRSRIPSEDLPIEARDEEYSDDYRDPVRRSDVEYYEDEEPMMAPPKGYVPTPSTTAAPKEEDSFMKIFESLFGGGGEEEKKVEEETVRPPQKPFSPPYRQQPMKEESRRPIQHHSAQQEESRRPIQQQPASPYRQQSANIAQETTRPPNQPYRQQPSYTTAQMYTTEIRTTARPTSTTLRITEATTTRKPTDRPFVYQQYPEKNNHYQQQPQKYHAQQSYYNSPPNRVHERPVTHPQPVRQPETESYYEDSFQPKVPSQWQEKTTTEKPTTQPVTTEKEIVRITEKPVVQQSYPERQTVKEPQKEVTYQSNNEWHSVIPSNVDNQLFKKENIDRQDVQQNEVKPLNNQNTPDYYNFINLPVHYSTKDTAIPLISGSYANTKIQGMGASKYEKNNSGKYSNHKYDPTTTTSKRPNYWSTRRPATSRPTAVRQPTVNSPIDFGNLEYDDSAIGLSADFGGYGNKAGVKVETERPTTKTTPVRTTTIRLTTTTPLSTTSTTTTTAKTTPTRTVPTEPAPVQEYEYDYSSYPAQVKPVQNPLNTPKPINNSFNTIRNSEAPTPQPTSTTPATVSKKPDPTPKEPEYEYYDYDTEPPVSSSTAKPTTTTSTSKYKIRYPSLSKDKLKHPEEKVAVVVATKIETTQAPSTTSTTTQPSTSVRYQAATKDPAPVFEESETEQPRPMFQATQKEEVKPIVVSPGKEENVNIVLVPAKQSVTDREGLGTSRRPDLYWPSKFPPLDYTTEFTVGAVQGQPGGAQGQAGVHQGHFIASSIAASPFDESDGPFRPIPRPPGMTASFQVVGDDDDLKEQPSDPPGHFQKVPPAEPEVHEEHEFIPSPQFHRPDPNHFIVGSSFNTKPANPQFKPPEFYPPQKNEVLGVKPKPQRPGFYNPPPKPPQGLEFPPNKKPLPQFGPKPVTDEEYYKPTNKPSYYTPKPTERDEDEDYGFFDKRPTNNKQTNVELSVDYDFDGIQTQPKPGEYVIFPKPQLNPEMNENQMKKTHIPLFQELPSTEPTKPTMTTNLPPQPPPQEKPEQEKQQEVASSYPRPHWEKNGKPSFLVNSQGGRQPLLPPQMSPNLIPPGNIPTRFRKPVTPPNLPPVRKNFNEVNFQTKPKPNLPNILPQFRPNAKLPGNGRPHRYPPNRRQENFPYRIQSEPDMLMHRDFEVEEEIVPKFITNRVKVPELEHMMMQKRFGVAAPPLPPQKRVQRTPVTTLQMLQQTQAIKKQQMPTTREDQLDATVPLVPPAYKPYKDDKKDVFLVYPIKTPFNSNIKIEDPDKIEYNYNQTVDQVPLLKPSKKKEKPKPEFPYGFVTPEERPNEQRKEVPKSQEVRPNLQDYMPIGPKGPQEGVIANLQDYMPSGAKVPNKKQERIDMNLHMQSNNQWNRVSTYAEAPLVTRKEDTVAPQSNPPTQYHTVLKNTNASEFTLGAVMHTLPEKNREGQVTSVSLNEENSSLVRPGLNVNERISNGKIVTVSMPLDVKEEKEEPTGFQAPFQASSSAQQGNQGWNFVQKPENGETLEEISTELNNGTTFNFDNFKPELIGGFKPIYNTPEPEGEERDRTAS